MSRKRLLSPRPGRGSLVLISSFLIASALLRLGTGAGQVLAKTESLASASESDQETPKVCEQTPDVQNILDALRVREKNLLLRDEQIKARMQALSMADKQVEAKLADLRQAEEALRSTIALADKAAENDLSRLTAVYQNMKSKDAAALFEAMDPEFAAGFLGRMNPEAAAGIMAGLSPKAGYTLSVLLAGRNAEVLNN